METLVVKDENLTSVISKASIKRLIRDVKDMKDISLKDSGIFYKHDDTDMLKGYAMIVGPRDTIYHGGYYFFTFKFKTDYPNSPPTVVYETNNDSIRFHPNFYRNGKVCISILNTWNGEPWSSCQTIKSVVLTLCSVFNKDPLLNEPGITHLSDYINIEYYNKIVKYANLKVAIIDVLTTNTFADWYSRFERSINESFIENKEEIIANYASEFEMDVTFITFEIYHMDCIKIDYVNLKQKLTLININDKNETI
tara:strand:+ start:1291 stop:2049 length:759 start_codon:yes stop_codon:yes gene_type:complete